MSERVFVLVIPGLRMNDLEQMPYLRKLVCDVAPLSPSFPAVSPVVQTCMTTGLLPQDHGIVATGEYDRATGELVRKRKAIATPTEYVWMALRKYYRDFRCDLVGMYPVDNSAADHATADLLRQSCAGSDDCAAIMTAMQESISGDAQLVMTRLPQLDAPGHQFGPSSQEFAVARAKLDEDIERSSQHAINHSAQERATPPLWIIASEYVIVPVERAVSPCALLQAGGIRIAADDDGNISKNTVRVMVEGQSAHVFIDHRIDSQSAAATTAQIADLFQSIDCIAEVLDQDGRARRDLAHPAAGDLVLVAETDTVFLDHTAFLNHTADPINLPKGAHGGPAETLPQRGLIAASEPGVLMGSSAMSDFDVAGLVLRQFGV